MSSHSASRFPLAVALAAGFLCLAASGPVQAQSVSSQRDQPTPDTLPPRAPTAEGAGDRSRQDRPVAEVAPPSAISTSTSVVTSDRKGKTTYTNPLDHLPAKDRAATGGRRE